MRVTDKMFYDRFLSDMQRNMDAIYTGNEQLSSGKRVNRPSDDPAAMARIDGYKTQLSSITQYKRAIDSAKSSLEAMDSSLLNMNDIMIRSKELALEGATGTTDPASRKMIAKEIGVLVQSTMSIANTKVGDKYIFAGYQSNRPPINITTGEFISDSNVFNMDISPSVTVSANLPASELFSFKLRPGDPASAPLPLYNQKFAVNPTGTQPTPPEPGTPYDADPLSALHMPVEKAVADPNASFTSGGTLSITVGDKDTSPAPTAVSVTIANGDSLNAVRDKINAADPEVRAAVVNLDTSGSAANAKYVLVIAGAEAGNSSQITINTTSGDAAGSGLYALEYDKAKGSANPMLVSDNITNYNYITDPTNPNFYSFNNNYLNGSVDDGGNTHGYLLRALNFLKSALENNDSGRIQKGLDYISKVSEKVFQLSAEVGARLNKLDAETKYQDDRSDYVTVYLSNDQDADMAKVVSDMTQKETALQGLRKISSDVLSLSLFDFIK